MAQDLYDELGVDRDASTAEIKRAYRRLARRHHPDAGGDAGRFLAVQQAWEVLRDPRGRAAYDQATVDAAAELAAAWARATQAVTRPPPPPRSPRDAALLAAATLAAALAALGVLLGVVGLATGVLGAGLAGPPAVALASTGVSEALWPLLADAVLYAVAPPVLVAVVVGRVAPACAVSGAGAGVVAVGPRLDALGTPTWDVVLLAAFAGAAVGTLAAVTVGATLAQRLREA